jgi:hypothetical protein
VFAQPRSFFRARVRRLVKPHHYKRGTFVDDRHQSDLMVPFIHVRLIDTHLVDPDITIIRTLVPVMKSKRFGPMTKAAPPIDIVHAGEALPHV